MAARSKHHLGYCKQCKTFNQLITLHDIEASIPGRVYPKIDGLFLDNEVNITNRERNDHLIEKGITIAPDTFNSCDFFYDEIGGTEVCKSKKLDICPFHVLGFNWGEETYHFIDCECLQHNYEQYLEVKKNVGLIPPCERYEYFDDLDGMEYNDIISIRKVNAPSAKIVEQKISVLEIIPLILSTSTFIHILSYNIDDYFLGILQTLALKNVDVVIIINPSAISKSKLEKIINIASFSTKNFKVVVNNKIHAKRIFIDGMYDIDLSSINLSYHAFYIKTENIANFSFATPEIGNKDWRIIKEVHDLKFLDTYRTGTDIFSWCKEKKPDIYLKCQNAYHRRLEEQKLIKKMRNR